MIRFKQEVAHISSSAEVELWNEEHECILDINAHQGKVKVEHRGLEICSIRLENDMLIVTTPGEEGEWTETIADATPATHEATPF